MAGRDLTSAFTDEIINDIIKPHVLVEAIFTSATATIWDGIGSISWDGKTWTGVGEFLGITDIEETVETKIGSIKINFSALQPAYKAIALSGVKLSNDVTVYLALLNSSGAVIADPEIVFVGKMDDCKITESDEMAVFELTVANRLVALETSKERRYTKQDQLQLYPADTGLRHVVNADKTIKWGSSVGV
jgi:hypothetical protein